MMVVFVRRLGVKYCTDFGTECHLDESCLREGRHIKDVESDGAQCVYVSTTGCFNLLVGHKPSLNTQVMVVVTHIRLGVHVRA